MEGCGIGRIWMSEVHSCGLPRALAVDRIGLVDQSVPRLVQSAENDCWLPGPEKGAAITGTYASFWFMGASPNNVSIVWTMTVM